MLFVGLFCTYSAREQYNRFAFVCDAQKVRALITVFYHPLVCSRHHRGLQRALRYTYVYI